MHLLRRSLLLIAGLCSFAFGAEKADFLLVRNPSALSLLNRFEQSLSREERTVFAPLLPLRILDEKATLGDQITPAVKVSLLNAVYFLLKNNEVSVLSGPDRRLIKGCTVINDTIQVARSGAVSVVFADPPGGGGTALQNGELVIRLFQAQGCVFVLLPGAKPRYGWCMALPASAWKPVQKAEVSVSSVLDSAEYAGIIDRLSSANAVYAGLFGFFNTRTGLDKSVPAWTWEKEGNTVRCRLKGPRAYGELLRESTQALIRDLESLFIGKQVSVTFQDNELTVQTRGRAGL